jgi:hypothetical protein
VTGWPTTGALVEADTEVLLDAGLTLTAACALDPRVSLSPE